MRRPSSPSHSACSRRDVAALARSSGARLVIVNQGETAYDDEADSSSPPVSQLLPRLLEMRKGGVAMNPVVQGQS
jgi:hypothetical protein